MSGGQMGGRIQTQIFSCGPWLRVRRTWTALIQSCSKTNGWDKITNPLIQTVVNLLGPTTKISYFLRHGYLFVAPLNLKTFTWRTQKPKPKNLKQGNRTVRFQSRKCRGKLTLMSTWCAKSTVTTSPPLPLSASTAVCGPRAETSLRFVSFLFIFLFLDFSLTLVDWLVPMMFCSVFNGSEVVEFLSFQGNELFLCSNWSVLIYLLHFSGKIDRQKHDNRIDN